MEDRDTELKYTMPTHEEIDARVRQAYELRSEMLAQGFKWMLRQAYAGLHWLVGLEWGDADRSRRDELKLRFLRAAAPAHIAPAPVPWCVWNRRRPAVRAAHRPRKAGHAPLSRRPDRKVRQPAAGTPQPAAGGGATRRTSSIVVNPA